MAEVMSEQQQFDVPNFVAPNGALMVDRRTGTADRRRNLPDRRMGGRDRRRGGAGRAEAHEAVARDETVEISVVMPCLNEEGSVGICVQKAWDGLRRTGRTGEVIVSDNGSTDRSVEVAQAAGARVVHRSERGYGNAYLAGFDTAHGSIIVMGDSDNSYDFSVLADLVAPIVDEGHDYVLGSRLQGRSNAAPCPGRTAISAIRCSPPSSTYSSSSASATPTAASGVHAGRTREDGPAVRGDGTGVGDRGEGGGRQPQHRGGPHHLSARVGKSKLNSVRDRVVTSASCCSRRPCSCF